MNKKLIAIWLLSISIATSGCFYQEIDQKDIRNSADACKSKDGVYSIIEGFNSSTVVTCKNGDRFNIDRYKIKEAK